MAEDNPELPIHNMDQRHHALIHPIAPYYLQAARVCLDRHHESPATFQISEESQQQNTDADVIWEATDDQVKAAWGNDDDATRDGAYACIIAAVELVHDLRAIRRAETRTGADYYMGAPETPADDLENLIRLEVSGVDHDSASVVRSRLRGKLRQAGRGESDLPAMAGVIGFKAQLILLARLEEL